jgi:hypothetical protein
LQDLEKTQEVGIFREERLALWNSFGIFGVPFLCTRKSHSSTAPSLLLGKAF